MHEGQQKFGGRLFAQHVCNSLSNLHYLKKNNIKYIIICMNIHKFFFLSLLLSHQNSSPVRTLHQKKKMVIEFHVNLTQSKLTWAGNLNVKLSNVLFWGIGWKEFSSLGKLGGHSFGLGIFECLQKRYNSYQV